MNEMTSYEQIVSTSVPSRDIQFALKYNFLDWEKRMTVEMSWAVRALIAGGVVVLQAATGVAQGTVPEPLPSSTQPAVAIHVDLNQTVGPYKPIYSWFGYDEANYTTMRHGTELLDELHDLSPVPVYIRAHHLLTSGDGVAELEVQLDQRLHARTPTASPSTTSRSSTASSTHTKPRAYGPWWSLALCRRISRQTFPTGTSLTRCTIRNRTISGKSNNPPKDYAKWGELARVVTAHLVERYGKEDSAAVVLRSLE